MLQLIIPKTEYFDEKTYCFINVEEQKIELEHSLVSVAKWESKWCKSFFSNKKKEQKTYEESLDYVRCMTLTPDVDPMIYQTLTQEQFNQVNEYIQAPMTATTFWGHNQGRSNSETITAELIYYWMIALNIPFECQYWHLNRLLTLIRVCDIKNTPSKKMSKGDLLRRNCSLNTARRNKLHSKG